MTPEQMRPVRSHPLAAEVEYNVRKLWMTSTGDLYMANFLCGGEKSPVDGSRSRVGVTEFCTASRSSVT